MKQALLVLAGFAFVAMLAVLVYQNHRRFHRPLLTTPYQAVTLSNGTVLYGRIDYLGTEPVLRDVFSVQLEPDPQTQKQQDMLVKRKDGVNGADHVIFPFTSILFIEPVQPDSPTRKLIADVGGPFPKRERDEPVGALVRYFSIGALRRAFTRRARRRPSLRVPRRVAGANAACDVSIGANAPDHAHAANSPLRPKKAAPAI